MTGRRFLTTQHHKSDSEIQSPPAILLVNESFLVPFADVLSDPVELLFQESLRILPREQVQAYRVEGQSQGR